MNEQSITIPFVGVLDITVRPNGVEETTIREQTIAGMLAYLNKELPQAWMSEDLGDLRPSKVEFTKLIETLPLYAQTAPDAVTFREEHASWSHAWAFPRESFAESEEEQEDDVTALLRELAAIGVQSISQDTGGGCIVAQVELMGGQVLMSSAPDGPELGYYWGIHDYEGDLLIQGSWPGSDAATAAKNIDTMIKTFGKLDAGR
ncbi:hypothetical protein [Streptomyces sp. BH105]|uniref:hypothetical protein n=1 Tax=Streptomyces sp. BH105 TaxID=3410408 RepID=UPI003CEE512E